MDNKHLIWVATVSGVVGFEPYEIAEFEREFEKLKPYIAIEDQDDAKWNFFNEYFEDALCFRTGTSMKSSWAGWNRRSAGRRKRMPDHSCYA